MDAFRGGFLKPYRDLASAFLVYWIVSLKKVFIPTVQYGNLGLNIWVLLLFYIVITVFSEVLSGVVSDMDGLMRRPFDATSRWTGCVAGYVLLSVIIVPAYLTLGGNDQEILSCILLAVVFSLVGIMARRRMHKKSRFAHIEIQY
jgi:hypothetical protein